MSDKSQKKDISPKSNTNSNGVNVNTKLKFGVTPLMFASSNGHAGMVRAFIDRGADINCQVTEGDRKGWSALTYACFGGHSEVVDILLEKGGKAMTAKDVLLAHDIATEKQHKEIVESLKQHMLSK